MSFIWTQTNIAHLRDMWLKGLTGGQIAKAIGAPSPSAVIGKARRVGLPGRASPISERSRSVSHREPKPPRTESNNPAGRTPNVDRAEIRRLLATDMRGDMIAARVGCSASWVSRIKNRAAQPFLPFTTPRAYVAPYAEPKLASPVPSELAATRNSEPIRFSSAECSATAITLAKIEAHMCRYIIGESRGSDTTMCGGKTERGSWCEHHRARVITVRTGPAADILPWARRAAE